MVRISPAKGFEGRTAVITGGATGIGKSVAVALAAAGATVFVGSRSRERGADFVAELRAAGHQVSFVPTDVAEDEQVAALAAQAANRSGRIDIWFNNAGMEGQPVALGELDDEYATQILAVNLKGTYSGMRHAVRNMDAGGVIINNVSPAGTRVFIPVGAIYGATKAAVVSLTRAFAIGLQPKGISVFAIAPWIVDTPMLDRMAGSRGTAGKVAIATAFAPSGRLTTPEDVASVVIDLCTDEPSFSTGDVILVDADATTEALKP